MFNLLIFGPPGVGKGTQAELISKKLNLFHLSTGEFLRKAIAEETEIGKKAKQVVEAGKLVSDEIMIEIVKDALKNNIKENGFILDGFPRTVPQAIALAEIFKELKLNNILVIHLNTDETEIVRRLLNRGRSDDIDETIRHRLHVYQKETKPVIEFYNNSVLSIDGTGEIEKINSEILENLQKLRN